VKTAQWADINNTEIDKFILVVADILHTIGTAIILKYRLNIIEVTCRAIHQFAEGEGA
jgi:hypothetical protein